MEIKRIPESDFAQMIKIVQGAYAGSFNGSQQEAERLDTVFKTMTSEGQIIPLGAYDNTELMGSVFHYTFDTNFHNNMIKTAGIGTLAVDLLHKKKGVAKALIDASFELAHDDEISLYYLYPFNTKFYRNFGFGYGNPISTYCFASEDVKVRKTQVELKACSDLEAVFKLHNNRVKTTNGMSLKSYIDQKKLKNLKNGRIISAYDQDILVGYMVMSQKSLDPMNSQSQKIVVQELMYTTRQALYAFMNFFASQKDQVDYIEYATFDKQFHFLLSNTKFVPKPQTLDIISLKFADVGLGLMPLALEPQVLLDYLTTQTRFNAEFVVSYPKKPTQSYLMGGSDVVIKLSINAFSSWVTGVVSLQDLYEHGDLESSDVSRLIAVDQSLNLRAPESYTRY